MKLLIENPVIQTSTKATGEIWENLKKLDLGAIVFRLQNDLKVPSFKSRMLYIDEAIIRYKRFMYLKATSGNHLIPADDINITWNCHITHTEKYINDCIEVFGFYIHNFPYWGLRGSADASEKVRLYRRTAKIYEHNFNDRYKI